MSELLLRNRRLVAAAVAAVIVVWAAATAVRVLSPLDATILGISVAYAIYYAYERGREHGLPDDQPASMALLCELTETQEVLAATRTQLAEEQAVVEALTSQFSPDQAQP